MKTEQPDEEILIDDNIPVPNRLSKYPYKTMKVGDSFKIPATNINSALNACSAWAIRQDPIWVFTDKMNLQELLDAYVVDVNHEDFKNELLAIMLEVLGQDLTKAQVKRMKAMFEESENA